MKIDRENKIVPFSNLYENEWLSRLSESIHTTCRLLIPFMTLLQNWIARNPDKTL